MCNVHGKNYYFLQNGNLMAMTDIIAVPRIARAMLRTPF
jgi:hypothetical protein